MVRPVASRDALYWNSRWRLPRTIDVTPSTWSPVHAPMLRLNSVQWVPQTLVAEVPQAHSASVEPTRSTAESKVTNDDTEGGSVEPRGGLAGRNSWSSEVLVTFVAPDTWV